MWNHVFALIFLVYIMLYVGTTTTQLPVPVRWVFDRSSKMGSITQHDWLAGLSLSLPIFDGLGWDNTITHLLFNLSPPKRGTQVS